MVEDRKYNQQVHRQRMVFAQAEAGASPVQIYHTGAVGFSINAEYRVICKDFQLSGDILLAMANAGNL